MVQKPRFGMTLVELFVIKLFFLAVFPIVSIGQANSFDTNGNGLIDEDELKVIIDISKQRKPIPKSIIEKTVMLPGNVSLEFVKISSGKFTMGSPDNEQGRRSFGCTEGPQHEVTISKDFYMGKYEVTQAQWKAVMGSKLSYYMKEPNHPAEHVSWYACQVFIAALNDPRQGTFRLPTEAEWEYACRAGTETRYYWGDSDAEDVMKQYCWYNKNAYSGSWTKPHAEESGTQPVGLKLPNAWGLYDMIGNVCEWCNDWKYGYPHEGYSSPDAQIDPQGPSSGLIRIFRSGYNIYDARSCRSACRGFGSPDGQYSGCGLRLVRSYP